MEQTPHKDKVSQDLSDPPHAENIEIGSFQPKHSMLCMPGICQDK